MKNMYEFVTEGDVMNAAKNRAKIDHQCKKDTKWRQSDKPLFNWNLENYRVANRTRDGLLLHYFFTLCADDLSNVEVSGGGEEHRDIFNNIVDLKNLLIDCPSLIQYYSIMEGKTRYLTYEELRKLFVFNRVFVENLDGWRKEIHPEFNDRLRRISLNNKSMTYTDKEFCQLYRLYSTDGFKTTHSFFK